MSPIHMNVLPLSNYCRLLLFLCVANILKILDYNSYLSTQEVYKDLYNYEYLSGYLDFKIKVPVLCRMPQTNAADLIIYLYNTHKTQLAEQPE